MAHVARYDYGLLFPFLFSLQSTPGSSPLAMAIMPRPMRRALVGSISSTHRRLCPTQWSTSPRTWPTLRSIRRFPHANNPVMKKVLEFSKSGSDWCEGHWMIFQLQIFGIQQSSTFFMIIVISFHDATLGRGDHWRDWLPRAEELTRWSRHTGPHLLWPWPLRLWPP